MKRNNVRRGTLWKQIISNFMVVLMWITIIAPTVQGAEPEQASVFKIVIGERATEMQEYAAQELQKYLYQLSGECPEIVIAEDGMSIDNAYVVGTLDTNSILSAISEDLSSIGEQGYVLKKVGSTLYIGGYDDEGVLYGVYGLLDDHYGIGFYFSGDVIPEKKSKLSMPEVDEVKTPRQYRRGILPWTNFPQSSTVYSTEDWEFIIDQMARMRMNFLNIHNYNGQSGHNEMFHNFTYNGITSRNWNATAKTGHSWFGPGWDVNEYLFGATDLFDDYDFGADSTIHNDSLDNLEVFAKGYSQFQYIIDYAHSRGVKMGLGLDINLVMPDYGVSADAEGLPEIQAKTVLENYEDLDTIILYISETIVNYPNELARWRECFDAMYEIIREERPDMQIAVSGWGLKADIANSLPDDVVIAPIADYSSGFVNGSEVYPKREFWGGPWAEKDFDSSVYFYPFNMELSDTITAYQQNKDTMDGLFTLSWRLTDGVDVKMMYIAKAPWDTEEKYTTAEAVYREYAERCYGSKVVEDMTDLICNDEKTVQPTLWSECQDTPQFSGNNREADINKLQQMINRVDAAISITDDTGCVTRLGKLRDRLVCAQYYCKLDQNFNSTDWENLQDDFSVWTRSFVTRVDDISSLGNNISAQNRFVQLRYLARETELRNEQEIKAPVNVVAKSTQTGALLTWEYEAGAVDGFNIYRNNEKVNQELLPSDLRSYEDDFNGNASYTITAVDEAGNEGIASIAQTCNAGDADITDPQIVVVSPPTSVRAGQAMDVKARVIDDSVYGDLQAFIHYRALGSDSAFTTAEMENRVKSTFTASIDTTEYAGSGMEYYISVTDGKNEGVWPTTAPGLNAVSTVYVNVHTNTIVRAPMSITAENGGISWSDSEGDVFWYKIYRGETSDFIPSVANYVTYVEKGTTFFADVDADFDGSALSDKTVYYRVTAVDKYMNESIPSMAVEVKPTIDDPLSDMLFISADELRESKVSVQDGSSSGSVLGYVKANGYAKFGQLQFSPTIGYNAVNISYSCQSDGGILSVWIDGPTEELGGTKLGEKYLGSTGKWENFNEVTISLDPVVTGTHDVYFVYGTESGYLYNLDTFRFTCVHVSDQEDISITTDDMMAYKETVGSAMKEDSTGVTEFGNEGDRIVLGKGFRPDAENASAGGGAQVVDLPGYTNLKCVGFMSQPGCYFEYEDLPAGEVYLAYDKHYADPSHVVSIYINGEKKNEISLPDTTGSVWGLGIHKIMYVATNVTAKQGDTVRISCDVNNDISKPIINGIKLFVEQPYTAKQLDISYSNNADTQFSLYVDGVKTASIILPDSDDKQSILSVPAEIDEGLIELVAEADDVNVNGGEKAAIYKITLCEAAISLDKTVTVTANEGGTVSPDGTVSVKYGDDQAFVIQADDGFVVESVMINGVDYGMISGYTFESLTYDATLDVTFGHKNLSTLYKVDVEECIGGTITVSANNAEKGQPILLNVTPDDGYQLKAGSLKYMSASYPNGIAIHEYSTQFIMPGEDVVVMVEFEPAEIEVVMPFIDVKEEAWYYNSVLYVYKNGLLYGTSDTTFEPISPMTRGMLVQVLYRMEDRPEVSEDVPTFPDVNVKKYYADAISWAAEENLVSGYKDGTFGPEDNITREQIAKILYRYAEYKGYDVTASQSLSGYKDASQVAAYAVKYLEWATAEGLIKGDNGTLNPKGDATRAEISAILRRFIEKYE